MASAAVVDTSLRDKLGAVSPQETVPYIKELDYGEPGAGKTFKLGSAGANKLTGPILIADIEGGSLTLRGMPNVDVVQTRTVKELENIINELYKDKTRYYKSFAIDSITELQKLDMTEIMTETKGRKPETDIDVPSQREWGKSSNHMRLILRAAKDLPMHVFVTALEAHEQDDATGLMRYYPSIPGKLRGEIPGFFDIVGRMEAKPKKINGEDVIIRTLQTAKTNRVIAKDRTGSLPGLIENPTIPGMWEIIGLDQPHNENKTLTEILKPGTE